MTPPDAARSEDATNAVPTGDLVGVRAASAGAGGAGAPLRWVRQGTLTLALGERVVVHDGGTTWLGMVVIPAERLLEWPTLDDGAGWPVVERGVADDEWPEAPVTAGRRLLDSLNLPPFLTQRPGS